MAVERQMIGRDQHHRFVVQSLQEPSDFLVQVEVVVPDHVGKLAALEKRFAEMEQKIALLEQMVASPKMEKKWVPQTSIPA